VLDIFLEIVFHVLIVKGKYANILEKVLYILFYFYFYFFLDVPFGTVVTGIFNMRPGKHDLHFLVGVDLLPHAFVNIPDEKMYIGVYFLYFCYSFSIHLCIYFKIYLHIFTYSFLTVGVEL
jgi:hypothetical protein